MKYRQIPLGSIDTLNQKFEPEAYKHNSMKILFFQWKYHPNRHPIVKALLDRGHEVKYISQFAEPNREHYDAIEPIPIGYSRLYRFIAKKTGIDNDYMRMTMGWPPLEQLYQEMRSFNPDLVIVRNYGLVQAIVLTLGNILGADGILQEQHPKYKGEMKRIKPGIDKLYQLVFGKPLVRVTPIRGNVNTGETTDNVYYVPFPIDSELYKPLGKRTHFKNGKVNIISVGRFSSKRKNLIGLLCAINTISERYDIHLTLVGLLDDESNHQYQKLLSYIDDNSLNKIVNIRTNMDYQDLQEEYKRHDLSVLPAFNEPFGMAGLESMAAGLPLICSDQAGVSSNVEHGYNGYLFKEGSQRDLAEKIELAVQNRDNLIAMSENAIEVIKRDHLPETYCDRLEQIIEENFGD